MFSSKNRFPMKWVKWASTSKWLNSLCFSLPNSIKRMGKKMGFSIRPREKHSSKALKLRFNREMEADLFVLVDAKCFLIWSHEMDAFFTNFYFLFWGLCIFFPAKRQDKSETKCSNEKRKIVVIIWFEKFLPVRLNMFLIGASVCEWCYSFDLSYSYH